MDGNGPRRRRKLEHVVWAARLPDGGGTGLPDLHLVHDALGEVDLGACCTATTLFGHRLALPLLIGAMTGGAPEVSEVNGCLARAAAAAGVGMGVGSQTSALDDPAMARSYAVVREAHRDGLVLGNVGARATPEQAAAAVAMVSADALSVHLNPAQELFMTEGERAFTGGAERIARIVAALPVPVLAKEVGCGIARGPAQRLLRAGVGGIDVAGRGGTDFIGLERARAGRARETPFAHWGIPTAVALLETLDAVRGRVPVIASGGVRSGLEAAACLAAGAAAVGIAGPLLRAALRGGTPAVLAAIEAFAAELRTAMALCGAQDIEALRRVPLVVLGATRDWLHERGVATAAYARRGEVPG